MNQLTRNIRLTWIFTSTLWQDISQNRLGALTWVVNGAINPLLMMAVWLVIGSHQQLAMNQSEIITYYILTAVVSRTTGSWAQGKIGSAIRTGDISNSFLKPFPYLIEVFSHTLGLKFVRLITLLPIVALVIILFKSFFVINSNLMTIILLLVSLLMGFLIRFFWASTLGLLTFWTEEEHSINNVDELISNILSGELIPLVLAPLLLKHFITYSPYRFFVSFPIEIALRQNGPEKITEGFIVGLLYLSLLIVVNRIIFRLGTKKYGAYGH